MLAVDRKRITGPESSCPPLPCSTPEQPLSPVIQSNGLRKDQRRPDQHRPMCMSILSLMIDIMLHIVITTELVPFSSGSAYLELTPTLKLYATVHGPRPSKRIQPTAANTGRVTCEFKYAPFATKIRKGYMRDVDEKDISAMITSALSSTIRLDLYPRLSIDVYVMCLEVDGVNTMIANALTVASVACVCAGIEMKDVVIGCSVGYVDGSRICVDCTEEEESACQGGWVVGRRLGLGDVVHVGLMDGGGMDPDAMEKGLEVSEEASKKIYGVVKHVLKGLSQEN